MRNGDPVNAAIASRYSANAALTGRRIDLLCPAVSVRPPQNIEASSPCPAVNGSAWPHAHGPRYPERAARCAFP